MVVLLLRGTSRGSEIQAAGVLGSSARDVPNPASLLSQKMGK